MNISWITSQKGQPLLTIDNYIFSKNGKGKKAEVFYWICADSKISGCTVRASTLRENVTNVKGLHNHSNASGALNHLNVKTTLKRKVDEEPEWSSRRVYNNHISELNINDAVVAPPFASLERTLQRHRIRNKPPLPNTRELLILEQEHSVTADGRVFILIDDGHQDRILMFATYEQLQRMCQQRSWWMDGTFTSNPEIFAQLYTIHVKIQDEFVPQCWCLLPDKQLETYSRLFRLMKQKAAESNFQMQPTCIHIDFEQAVVQAVRIEFGIEPLGCLFHFSQSILRNLQQHGLQISYNNNNPQGVRTWIRQLIALPLLPPLRIDQAFQAIVVGAPDVPGRDAMNNYVFNTYVNPNGALYPRDVWNCYGVKDRTTNVCEGYHSVINSQLLMGAPPRKRKTKYILVDEALDRLRNTYFGAGIPSVARLLQYANAVAHQMYDVKH